jgi:hypothetical protein
MKTKFLKIISSVHTNNLVVEVLMGAFNETAMQVRRSHSKAGRRKLVEMFK